MTTAIDVYIHTLNSSGIDILVNLYFKVSTGAEELAARDALTQEILEQAQRCGVEIAVASQTIVLAHPPEPDGANPPHKRLATNVKPAEAGPGETLRLRRNQ